MKRNHLPLKEFISQLKANLKGEYSAAVWPIAGMTLLYVAIQILLAMLFFRSFVMLNYATMLIMYGMFGQVLLQVAQAIGIVLLWIIVTFCMYVVNTAFLFNFQDMVKNPDLKVSASSLWVHFKHLNKNQVLRLTLYNALFVFLWTLPLNIVDVIVKNQIVTEILQYVNAVIAIWKALEYAQAPLMYRDQQPAFLGQSMRHAYTASRRFMGGKKLSLLVINLVVICLPVLVWTAIFGGMAFYGSYTATTFVLYAGVVIALLGYCAYMPVIYLTMAQFYEQSKAQSEISVEGAFADTFKSVDHLTGQAYDDAKDPVAEEE